jgi:hypothetical protein
MQDKGRAATSRRAQSSITCEAVGSFPAPKEAVAEAAATNGAPQDMVTQIRNADTERFESPEEVMQALQSPPDTPDVG